MLGQHSFEFCEAARVLVLELDARWPIGVLLRKCRHACRENEIGDRARLSTKALPLAGLGAVAATGHAQGQRPGGITKAEMKRSESAHRKANNVRALEAQMIEHRSDVVGRASLGIGSLACRHLRRRITSGIECDRAIAPAEMAHLCLPATMIPGKFVHEDQRRAGTGLFIIKANSVIRSEEHTSELQSRG